MPVEHADLAYVLAATGLRISEALAMRWDDIAQDSRSRPVLIVPKSKTPSGERAVPLSPQTVDRLVRHRANSQFATDTDSVFPVLTGTQLDS